MTQEMAMFWFGMSILILFWGLSQYTPTPKRRLYAVDNLIAFQRGLIEGSLHGKSRCNHRLSDQEYIRKIDFMTAEFKCKKCGAINTW